MTGITDADLARFNLEINNYGTLLLPSQLVDFHQKVIFQVLEGCIFGTPVLTGRAKGGWVASIGSFQSTGETGVRDKHGGATMASAISALSAIPPFSVAYINNNVLYIIPLEKGHSGQKPHGWIAATLDRVAQQFR